MWPVLLDLKAHFLWLHTVLRIVYEIIHIGPLDECSFITIGPLQDTITWCKIRHTGTQTAHWDIQNKDDLSLSDLSRFVLDVPVRSLRSSMTDFVPCDRILQRAY